MAWTGAGLTALVLLAVMGPLLAVRWRRRRRGGWGLRPAAIRFTLLQAALSALVSVLASRSRWRARWRGGGSRGGGCSSR
jgi:hypothetical protein